MRRFLIRCIDDIRLWFWYRRWLQQYKRDMRELREINKLLDHIEAQKKTLPLRK